MPFIIFNISIIDYEKCGEDMRYKITVCLIIFGMLLMLCGCGYGDSSQETSVPDVETPSVLPSETDEQFSDGDLEATETGENTNEETHDETREEPEENTQIICIKLDETRQKAIDNLLGTEEPGLHYSVPIVIGEGDYVEEVNAVISDYYDEVLLPQSEVFAGGGYAALEKEFNEVLRTWYSWKAETYNGIVSLMISRHVLYDIWDYQCYAFLPDGSKATRKDILDVIGWTEEQFQNAVTEGILAFYPSEEELAQNNDRDREWINGRKDMTFQNLEEAESVNLYLTAEGELIIQTAIVPLAGPEREVVVFSALSFKNLSQEYKHLNNSSDKCY